MIEKPLSSRRIEYIDIVKGIGILLVVFTHAINSGDVILCKVIWSFHMPLFFFASGLLKYKVDAESFSLFFKKRFKSLIIPHLTLSIGLVIGDAVQSAFGGGIVDFKSSFTYWFLIAQFFVEMFWWVKAIISRRFKASIKYIFFIIEILSFLLIDYNGLYIFQQVLAGLVFMDIGEMCRPYIDSFYGRSAGITGLVKKGGIGVFGLCATAVLSHINTPILMYINHYGNKVLFIVTAFVGIMGIVDLSMCISSPLLRLCGSNSIVIYVTHFWIYKIAKWGAVHLVPGIVFSQYPIYYILFLVVAIIEIPTMYVANSFIPFAFGKKRTVDRKAF